MKRIAFLPWVPAVVFLLVPAPAQAWNDKGHMVVARLAWQKLSEKERAKAIEILRRHPHYAEYLSAGRPEGFDEDEWVFLRAATWADWVRGHHKDEFNHPTWHYIDYPFVPPGSDIDAKDHQPSADEENVVKQLGVCLTKIKKGSDADRAVYMCWMFHLVGDIHQPLHCTSMFSKQFPEGDRGGNLAELRVSGGKIKLHPFWDGLLGNETSPSSIGNAVKEIEDMLKDKPDLIKDDLSINKTFESWALESFAVAKQQCYLNGDLNVAATSEKVKEKDLPQAPDDYAKNCGKVARVQIAKAGERVADKVRTVNSEE
jgi:hypothetical protein